MARDPRWLVDGFSDLSGGIDSGNVPNLLQPNQCAFAVNATMRDGYAQCRPGFLKIPLVFTDETTASRFKSGRFQGAKEYRAPGIASIVAQIGGRTFSINLSSGYAVQEISLAGDLNPSNRDFTWMQQAEQWLQIQDGQSVPLIWNGATLRRSDLSIPEIPVGDRMAYVMGRMSVSKGRHYVMSDLYGTPSPTTTASLGHADAVLKYTENQYIGSGGAFSVPMDGGGITGMIPIATPNTILGQGPLLISTADAIFANDVPLDRDLWRTLTYPIQTIQSVLNGSLSHESMVPVNSDIWFRSRDGWRSFIQALRDFSLPGNTPQSHEMSRITTLEDERLLSFCSASLFDNRLLGCAWPQRDQDHGTWFKGLGVLDFSPVSSLQRKAPPAWSGLWTGLRFLRLVPATVENTRRLFAFVLNDADEIELWEISKDARFDDADKRIKWFIEGRGMTFKDQRVLKKLEGAELWIDRWAGDLTIELQYIPDSYPCPWPWKVMESICAAYKWCPEDDPATCKTVKDFQEQYQSQIEFPSPPDVPLNGIPVPARLAYSYQPKLIITGFCRVPLFLMYASPQTKTIQIAR